MLSIVLVQPEIHQNTGNIARTCAATGARLHLIRPLGFEITDRALKRAGLDYWYALDVVLWDSLSDFLSAHGQDRLWLFSTKAPRSYTDVRYWDGDFLVFGPESRGLPEELLEARRESCVRIPMRPGARSLNLSNSAAVAVYEALRQQNFPELREQGRMHF